MGGRRGAVVAALVVLSVALPIPSMATVAAQEGDGGLSIDAHSVYRVEPVERRVQVTVDLRLVNTVPDVVVGDAVRFRNFTEVVLPVPDEAESVAATGAGGALAVSVEAVPESIFDRAVVDLSPDLRSGAPQSVRLTYVLPDAPVRSEALTRVTPAFVSVFAVAVGDPGRSDVEIFLPAGYEEVDAPEMVEEVLPGGGRRITAEDIPDDGWFGGVVARDDRQLERRSLEVAGREVVIRAWPDDPEWAEFARREVEQGLPVLTALIGHPRERDLEVTEAFTPYLYGAGGWYAAGGEIEVGNRLEPVVLLHELAHDWFNAELFRERWISEGLAEEYATLVLTELGRPTGAPAPVDVAEPVRFPLNAWPDVEVSGEATGAILRYGYNAAWSVFRGIREEVGDRAFRRAITGALDDVSAYPGEEGGEGGDPVPPSWRYLLDLFEGVGSTRAAELFRAHVVTEREASLLDERSERREAYARLREAGDGWVPPAGVRRAMARWVFDQAAGQMEAARGILAVRDRLAAVAGDLDLALPRSLERAYEAASADDLADVRQRATDLVEAGRQVAAADRAVQAADGVWATVGSWGGGADEDLAEARAAFEDGDAAGASSGASEAVAAAQGVEAAGKRRIGVTLVMALLVAGGGAAAMAVRRRTRRGDPGGPPQGVEEAVLGEPFERA